MLDISVLMWYIMVRKDESNVLRKAPAPDVKPDSRKRKGPKIHLFNGQSYADGIWHKVTSERNPSNREDYQHEGQKWAISRQVKCKTQETRIPHPADEGRTAPTSSTSCMGREPQGRSQEKWLSERFRKRRAGRCGMWRIERK